MLAPNVPHVIKPVLDERGSNVCQVEFILDPKTAKPGLYRFEFRASVREIDEKEAFEFDGGATLH